MIFKLNLVNLLINMVIQMIQIAKGFASCSVSILLWFILWCEFCFDLNVKLSAQSWDLNMISLYDISFSRDVSPGRSPAGSPTKNSEELKRRALPASPDQKASELAASKHGRGISKSPSPNGMPKRVKKGRGFTERYAFVRRYRTPSPERSPHAYRYGERNIRRNFNRYVILYILFC